MPLRPLSPSDAFSDPIYVGTRNRALLGTSLSAKDEVFGSLAYLSEVKKAGRDLLVRMAHPRHEIDSTFRLFQSFIRQSRTFYESALTLHHRASALNYYYAFLNLAKAYICLKDPKIVSGKITHGLFYRFRKGRFSTQFLGIESKGLFPLFYQKIVGIALPAQFRPNVRLLLTYCSDIAHECETGGYGQHRSLPCRHRVLFDQRNTKTGFSLLAIQHFERIDPYKKALAPFFAYYDEVDATGHIPQVATYFRTSHPEARALRYFESKKHYPLDPSGSIRLTTVIPEINTALGGHYLTNPYRSEHEFFLTVPWSKKQQIPFNEILAIYILMFYLGSLVRYYPAYLESIIESTDSWMIERFVNSCTVTFLRHLGCLIAHQDNVYFPR